MNDLKPCPFCGNEVSFWTREATEDYQALIIDCKVCPANMEEWVYKYDKNFTENFEKKKTEMFKAWNSRIERTAKVDRDAIFSVAVCGVCHSTVVYPDNYCSDCGVKLDWSE